MEAIELILKIWGIREEYRSSVEEILRKTKPEYLGLSLAMLAQPKDMDDINTEAEAWMEEYLPEIQFL